MGFRSVENKNHPVALITTELPVLAVLTGCSEEKRRSNLLEATSPGALVIATANPSADWVNQVADSSLTVSETHPDLTGCVASVHFKL